MACLGREGWRTRRLLDPFGMSACHNQPLGNVSTDAEGCDEVGAVAVISGGLAADCPATSARVWADTFPSVAGDLPQWSLVPTRTSAADVAPEEPHQE